MEDTKETGPSEHSRSCCAYMISQTLWQHAQGQHGFLSDEVSVLKAEGDTKPMPNS